MYCQLKEKADHTFGLPVQEAFNNPRPVTGPDGTQHPRSIFKIWSDLQLNAIGYARMNESSITDGYREDGTSSDVMAAGIVTRTYGETIIPPPPPPDPRDFAANRKAEIALTIGGEGGYEGALGNQLDALLKWATIIRMKQSAVASAIDGMTEISVASRTALKTALDPVFDLPADLDSVLAKWTAAKGKFPKPT